MLTATGRRSLTSSLKQTPVTWLLLIVNILLFVIVSLQGGTFIDAASQSPLLQDTVLVPYLMARGEYWRLITSGFMHLGLMHLAFNMYALWILGRDCESLLGPLEFAVVYWLSLLAGSASVVWFSDPGTATAGASGAIFGLMGAELIILIRLKLKLTGLVSVLVLNAILGVTLPGISIQAHLGGLFAGILVTAGFLYVPMLRARLQRSGTVSHAVLTLWKWIGALLASSIIALALITGIDHITSVILGNLGHFV